MREDPKLTRAQFNRKAFIRRVLFFSIWTLLTSISVAIFWDLLERMGGIEARYLLLPLFIPLVGQLVFGFTHALFGFYLELRGTDKVRIENLPRTQELPAEPGRTALLFPVYNEDPQRYSAAIEVLYRDIEEAGQLEHFDIFILSDSTDLNRWVEEESLWLETIQRLGAKNKIFYRRRPKNINQKSGNVGDFCRRWGKEYDFMICFDADSLMSADTIFALVGMMSAHPECGIIQTMPRLFNGRTLFGRLQQFASRLNGRLSGGGLNFWQQGSGNYWGHNAIIRVEPFIQYCSLPELPGAQPLGGRVMSHDFVEAALIRRAGYSVWLAYDLDGTYEEMPPTLLDFAVRDRRWSQGNLQHLWIMLFGDVPFLNRVHMLNGVMAYLAGPLWFCFVALGTLLTYAWENSSLTLLTRQSSLPFMPDTLAGQGALVLSLCLGFIFIPKTFPLILLAFDKERAALYGGWINATLSVFAEILIFTLLAPSLMLFHTSFIVAMLFGKKASWNAQSRDGGGTLWQEAFKMHRGQMLVGILWALLAAWVDLNLMLWMGPILLGWILSVPLSVWTSREGMGQLFRRAGLFLTPEETRPELCLTELAASHRTRELPLKPIAEVEADYGLMRVVMDPYTNALHRLFLRQRKNQTDETREEFVQLRTRLLMEGATALSREEKLRLLSDVESVRELHKEIWSRPQAELSRWWQLAHDRFNRESLFRVDLRTTH